MLNSTQHSLCLYLGGSHLYGLATPNSDVDYRGVYLQTDPLYKYGFLVDENVTKQDATQDVSLQEFTNFLKLAVKSNTQTLECLFAPETAFVKCDPNFEEYVLSHAKEFVNTTVLFKSLTGYLHNERRLAFGERTGQLGGKRKAALDTYGFSYKNFSHMVRLSACGQMFFKTGHYPVDLRLDDPKTHELCLKIKTDPSSFTLEELTKLADEAQMNLTLAFDTRAVDYKPNYEYVRTVLKFFYSNY